MTQLSKSSWPKPSWSVVATVLAAPQKILDFAAYYLDIGADHLYIFLDEDRPEARVQLEQNPKITVTVTDADYWARIGRRPQKHQVRQTRNATKAYRKMAKEDWLLHCDVDEFVWARQDIAALLGNLAPNINSARVRSIEAMAPHPDNPAPDHGIWFKGCSKTRHIRLRQAVELYPRFGLHLRGGLLSHTEGKNFARVGLPKAEFRIHNFMLDGKEDPDNTELSQARLCHFHATDFDNWMQHLWYRFEKGAYRPDLPANPPHMGKTISMHDLLGSIYQRDGETGLRDFFDDVNVASPELCERLEKAGYLYNINLELAARRKTWFPDD